MARSKRHPFQLRPVGEAGFLLRRLQRGESLSMPHARPMPSIGAHCYELRIRDEDRNWRIVYRIDDDAIVVIDIFRKTTRQTPATVLARCQRRLRDYDQLLGEGDG